MTDLKTLSHEDLLTRTRNTAAEERRLGIELLHYLQEIERRRIYLPRFSSLHEYVVRELGYSDGAAHRRISAMRLMRELPEVEKKLSAGSLTLSTASQVQNFLMAERRSAGVSYSRAEKQALVSSIEHHSTRQTEALLAARSPRTAALLRERPRSIDGENLQVTIVLTKELQAKLDKLKNLMAHRHPNPSLAEQVEFLADLALRRRDPEAPGGRNATRRRERASAGQVGVKPTTAHPQAPRGPSFGAGAGKGGVDMPPAQAHPRGRSRFIPIGVRRTVWARAGGQCEHRLAGTGSRCPRRHRLQIDHRVPFAWGGRSEPENLQLLCAPHNHWKGDRLPSELAAPARENCQNPATP